MKILGLIPARGGSKGVKRKNIKMLGGKPLISYTIEQALSSSLLDKVVVSTEDVEIADIARTLGADVPFMRPQAFASDESPTIDTVIHALEMLSDFSYDAICLLQPTYPFRHLDDLNAALEKFVNSDADSLISMKAVPHQFHPNWVYRKASDGTISLNTGDTEPQTRRQNLQEMLVRDGAIYIVKTEVVNSYKTIYGKKLLPYIMKKSIDINIDTEEDWLAAEAYLNSKNE